MKFCDWLKAQKTSSAELCRTFPEDGLFVVRVQSDPNHRCCLVGQHFSPARSMKYFANV